MIYKLKRHPFEIEALLRRSLVLTYAVPEDILRSLVKPGLVLDTHEGFGFLAVAMVETDRLRPAGVPVWLGKSCFLTGYRLFVRYRTAAGKNLRGLQILRSDANRRGLVIFGNLLGHYGYRLVDVDAELRGFEYSVVVRDSAGDEVLLDVTASTEDPRLPIESIFPDTAGARRFAGPMPFTFAFEPQTNSIIRVEGVREEWHPRLVHVDVATPPRFEDFGIDPAAPKLASAFYLEDVPYRWKRGVVERITGG